MKTIILIIIVGIIYRQLSLLLNFNQKYTKIIVRLSSFLFAYIIIYKIYHLVLNRRNYYQLEIQPNHDPQQFIMTIEHHIIRIPLEDRVDLNIEDNHNVHNKTVRRTAVHAIDELKKSDRGQYTIESAFNEINEYLKSKPRSEDLASKQKDIVEKIIISASNSLQLIDEMDAMYYSGNIKEKEVIRLVWDRINHHINHNKRELIIENFIKELADCTKSGGSVHCCEGRITRILQSLQNCDSEDIVNLRPMWAFKEEIANKIGKYREKLIKKVPCKYSKLDEKLDLTDQDRLLLDQFNQCLIKNLGKRFEKDYVKPGYLNKEELTDLTKVYYDSLYDY